MAWSVPAVAVAGAVPAYAASPKPGLQGWVHISRRCNGYNTRLLIEGRGSAPRLGLWAENARPDTVVENAVVKRYRPMSLGQIPWTDLGQNGWRMSAGVDDPARPGFYRYDMTYSGAWNYDSERQLMVAATQPYFSHQVTGCIETVALYSRRDVVVDGVPYVIERGPLYL